MAKKNIFYRYDDSSRSKNAWRRVIIAAVAVILLLAGGYLLLLTQSPNLPISSPIDLNTADDADDNRNRIQIEKINLEVPYFADTSPAALEKGAWWRYSDRGNPEEGGNFILSAHRFFLGTTPQGTRARSPFYRLNELAEGDKIRVFYDGQWYDYEVSRQYSVKPDATEIEAETAEPRLTLYTCTLQGSADGRVVIEAQPLFETESQQSIGEGSPLLQT